MFNQTATDYRVNKYPAVSTAVSWEPIKVEYSTRFIPRGLKFHGFRFIEDIQIGFEHNPSSVIATLLDVGISESGDDESEALENLLHFITGTLGDIEDEPGVQLGATFANQVRKLRKILQYEQSNH